MQHRLPNFNRSYGATLLGVWIMSSNSISNEHKDNDNQENGQNQGRRYTFLVDGQPYHIESPILTGGQILEMSGNVPISSYELQEENSSGIIEPDQTVNLSEPGVERFCTSKIAGTING